MNPTQLPLKVLISPDESGYGPAASLPDFLPYLKRKFANVCYIGGGRSLELMDASGFDAVFDAADFERHVVGFDLFFTSCDFGKAEKALALGVPTAVYDSLSWFWPQMPKIAEKDMLYIAQDFHGVKGRLMAEKGKLSFPVIVKPNAVNGPAQQEKNLVLLNIEGIQSPHWPQEISRAYAEIMIRAFKNAIDPKDRSVIVCSAKIAEGLPDVKPLQRKEITALLPRVKYAVQTPDIGSIFDAAANDIPTLYLPPVSPVQGQLVQLLVKERQLDAWISWNEISPGMEVDYREDPKKISEAIVRNIIKLLANFFREKLENICRKAMVSVSGKKKSESKCLIDQFGSGGAEAVVNHLTAFAALRNLSHV